MHKILVIDDDSSMCETLEMYLTEEGYGVVTAGTGTEGLTKYKDSPTDVVILDIRLPDIDGFTVLKNLKRENANVKVIMITAFHEIDSRIKANQAGAFAYLKKPIDMYELDRAIENAFKTGEREK
jgi:two-component system response regulator AtoC